MGVIKALWIRNIKSFLRNKPALIFNLVFPFFFLFIFGELFSNLIGGGGDPGFETAYILAGIIVATVFDSALRVSSNTIDDMTSGFMKEVLVSPISRLNIVVGQFISSAIVATIQGAIIFIAGFLMGAQVPPVLNMIYAVLAMMVIGLVFAGFGLLIATKSKNIQTFQAVTIAITMPMTFISGAYLPFSGMPDILQTIGLFNPLTYAVSLFRTITLDMLDAPTAVLASEELSLAFEVGGVTIGPGGALAILLAFGVIFIGFATLAFTRVDFSRMNRNKSDSMDW